MSTISIGIWCGAAPAAGISAMIWAGHPVPVLPRAARRWCARSARPDDDLRPLSCPAGPAAGAARRSRPGSGPGRRDAGLCARPGRCHRRAARRRRGHHGGAGLAGNSGMRAGAGPCYAACEVPFSMANTRRVRVSSPRAGAPRRGRRAWPGRLAVRGGAPFRGPGRLAVETKAGPGNTPLLGASYSPGCPIWVRLFHRCGGQLPSSVTGPGGGCLSAG